MKINIILVKIIVTIFALPSALTFEGCAFHPFGGIIRSGGILPP